MDAGGKTTLIYSEKTLRRYWLRFKREACGAPGVIACIVAFFLLWAYMLTEKVYTSNPPDQPLVKVFSNFIPHDTFAEMHAALPHHPSIKRNELEPDNFKYTKGWLVKFNKAGLQRFRADKNFEIVLAFLDRVLDAQSNAFVMNLLIATPPPVGEDAVGTHVDDTIAMRHKGFTLRGEDFLAHKVNVLYTNVPEGMKGGELCVWPHENDESERNKAVVQPAENTMAEFRGDAYHMVKNFQTPGGQPRISLVFEQYRIPEHLYGRTIDFCKDQECDDLEVAGSWRLSGKGD